MSHQPSIVMKFAAKWSLMILMLWPLACRSEDEVPPKPLWEIQARLDGSGSTVFSEFLANVLGGKLPAGVPHANARLRIAGFENKDTPEQDWIAEIHDMPGIEKLLGDFAVQSHSKVLVSHEGSECVLWSDAAGVLRVASSAVNADQSPAVAAPLKEGAWLCGWIDLERIGDKGIQSRTLKWVEEIGFTVTSSGETITTEIRATLKSERVAEQAQVLVADLKSLLQEISPDSSSPAPALEHEVRDRVLIVRFHFTEAGAKRFLERIEKEFGRPEKDGKPAPAPEH